MAFRTTARSLRRTAFPVQWATRNLSGDVAPKSPPRRSRCSFNLDFTKLRFGTWPKKQRLASVWSTSITAIRKTCFFLALLDILEAYRRTIFPALEGVESPLDRFVTAVRTYCRVHAASSDATELAYRETASLGRAHRAIIKQCEVETNELLAQCVRDCITAGLFRDVNVDVYTYQVVMFSHTWALKLWNLRSRMTFEEYLSNGLDLLLRSVLTANGLKLARGSKGLVSK